MAQLNLPDALILPVPKDQHEEELFVTLQDYLKNLVNAFIPLQSASTSDETTGGTGSIGVGSQYVNLTIGSTTYKILHVGTV